jgi:hypothetical protein
MDKHNLSNRDIKKLQLFITKNLTALNRLGDDDFGIIAFAKTMVKI